MTTAEYLQQIQQSAIKIDMMRNELNELREMAISIGGSPEGERVQASSSGDRLANKVIRVVEKEQELSDMILKHMNLRNKIVMEIMEIDDVRYMQMLYKRYVELNRFEVIAVEMNYDYKWTCKLHGNALKYFEQKILKHDKTRPNTT